MGREVVSLQVGGRVFRGIKSVDLSVGFDLAARAFNVTLAPSAALLETFAPGTALVMAFNGDLVFTGYVDRLRPSFKRLRVAGRSKAQDFIDCAAIDEQATGNFQNQTVLQIAQSLDRFGVGITSDQQLDPIDDYQITPGETAFGAVEKLSRDQGLTLFGQGDGSIKITKPGAQRQAGGLFQGVNIKDGAEADLNWAHRHSHIIVRGQSASGTTNANLQVQATAQDPTVARYRPHVHVEDADIDQPTAQALANARSQREAAASLKCTIPVQGFRDAAGMLWTPGNLVWVEADLLGLAQVMLIKHASFSKRVRGGSTTRLSLCDPRAFGGKAAKGSQGGAIWDVGSPAIDDGSDDIP